MRFLHCVHAEFLLVLPRFTRTRLGVSLLALGGVLVWLSAHGLDPLTIACTAATGGHAGMIAAGLASAAAVGGCAVFVVLVFRNGGALALFLFMAVAGTVAPERLVDLARPGVIRLTAASALELGPALWHYRDIARGDVPAALHALAWAGLGVLCASASIARRGVH